MSEIGFDYLNLVGQKKSARKVNSVWAEVEPTDAN